MVINELLEKSRALMKGIPYGNPLLESILILSKLLDKDKVYIYTHGQEKVSEELANEFMVLVEKRARGYPMSYLLGEKEFMGLDLHIEEGVLIPRPDTEILVEYIIKEINKNHKGKKISLLDIGVGSGAISLSLAKEFPNIEVYGIDLYEKPLSLANKNKESLGLDNIYFFQSNLFEKVDPKKKFHIIVSNPPYIKTKDIEDLQKDVKDFEPLSALDGGSDGLDFYRKITRDAKNFLYKNGLLAYEIGYNQSQQVSEIMLKEGYYHIEKLKDFQDYYRVIAGRWK